jgi:arylsulfatase A-like enzyme
MSTAGTGKFPNVILITTDQQRKDSLGCYGSDFVHTPNLDRLAEEGVTFDRAYCTSPVCTPSRATLFTGKYVSKHGAWNVGTSVPEDRNSLPHLMKKHGYRTYHIGKLHFQPFLAAAEQSRESRTEWERIYPAFSGPYYGFDRIEMCLGHTTNGVAGHYGDWVRKKAGTVEFASRALSSSVFGGEAVLWDLPPDCTNTEWVRERALAFLDEQGENSGPFFLNLGFQDPHHPHALPREIAQELQPERIPLPRYREGELEDKPPFFMDVYKGRWNKDHPLHGAFALAGQGFDTYRYDEVKEEDARLGRAFYYRMVELIDGAVGDILRKLEERGLADNTIVVFTTDHGELLGDHGIWMKGPFHYEPLINVPFIIRWKNRLKPGRAASDLFSLVDLAPTLLSLCGIEPPPDMDGLDFSGALLEGKPSPRQAALVEHVDDPAKIRLKTIVTERCKMTVYIGQPYGELYDLKADPHELQNRWSDPGCAAVRQELYGRLLLELERTENRAERIAYA